MTVIVLGQRPPDEWVKRLEEVARQFGEKLYTIFPLPETIRTTYVSSEDDKLG